ncbi:Sugar kinase of the NBD/HSP70 family, may contain an N-terminal HTH domain [Leifsonia sp. 98AMF]|uniref:ROK family transcriptional regulator n=1 Tax=unclassified Leifsonia TaxID=2663824 RepID=UPI0008794739|nr:MULTISPECIES: ROK family protein [unclassified Leifsonia]SDH61680.1 Sugar kinase of the NBD/HSP70 family, may contain an N-terminal HTH domain [Leifsonia sp. 197AMF]SDI77428.1 Sugar kinase of the NBD/HSP70 family, may contain an N-terminal HTH domain [Leifsonia sp. 466MF]SDK09390.1 Sugar kinase of the NBD/HSP70 family, may contain an N-terminal HTH domain [Leifsonia sp. 157MF]SDN80841.1 Sugar kinase of the NBD/HSP70 family, may contain an N-terminal HTH domain [Leifsonia sp. 509MF]SEN26557.
MTTLSPLPSTTPALGTPGNLLQLVRSGHARSRSDLARITGLAPSTVGLRVNDLLRLGVLTETGTGAHGGRKARHLKVDGRSGIVAAVDIGASHVRVAIADLAGNVLSDEQRSSELIDADPGITVDRLWSEIEAMAVSVGREMSTLRGLAVGIPAPVSQPDGRIVSPAFMPSWNQVRLADWFALHTSVPVHVENDANLYAIAECPAGGDLHEAHVLAVKLGTRIGSGIISAGVVHRGFNGAAGEISHTRASGEASIPCSCSVPNCLESVASGGALVARLRQSGRTIADTAELVQLGADGDPQVVEVLREAGREIGAALSAFVNFFNPHDVVLGGTMSNSGPLVAALRAELFRTCLPLVTEDLDVRSARIDTGLASMGGLRLALDSVLHPHRVDQLVGESETGGAR